MKALSPITRACPSLRAIQPQTSAEYS